MNTPKYLNELANLYRTASRGVNLAWIKQAKNQGERLAEGEIERSTILRSIG